MRKFVQCQSGTRLRNALFFRNCAPNMLQDGTCFRSTRNTRIIVLNSLYPFFDFEYEEGNMN